MAEEERGVAFVSVFTAHTTIGAAVWRQPAVLDGAGQEEVDGLER